MATSMAEESLERAVLRRFAGKRIVISGAGRGLGLAYAERLGREGASVIIAEIDPALGTAAERSLTAQGFDARFIETDVASEASLQRMARLAAEGSNGIHGLVTNAGWANNVGGKAYDEISLDAWDRMMAINVRGTWLSVRAIGPLMRDGGAIVTISSDCIYWGAPRLLHYATSKSAIVGMTRSLARELGERMIRVNCLLPGLTVVEATSQIPEQRWNDYAERQMLKRKQMPDDLDGVVAFLLSDDAKFITGQTLTVDGGFSLH
jgi:NAD(P)-dependent dehydrogenase (short-subunit alcohol dehydrogenase family)